AAARYFGFPSQKLLVIGVTGTKGKSSAANFIWAGLEEAGISTGLLSSAIIRVGESHFLNAYHMTMPSPFIIQKLLYEMHRDGCAAAIIETTSEGIAQYRHVGIAYDILVFTNLTPEHVESHGTFQNYRAAKQVIFKELSFSIRKHLK